MEKQLKLEQTNDNEKPITINGIDFIDTGTIDNRLFICIRERSERAITTQTKIYEVFYVTNWNYSFEVFQTTSLYAARKAFNTVIEKYKEDWLTLYDFKTFDLTTFIDNCEEEVWAIETYLADIRASIPKDTGVTTLLGYYYVNNYQRALLVKTYEGHTLKEYFEIDRDYSSEYEEPWSVNKVVGVCNNDDECQHLEKGLVDAFNREHIESIKK